MAAPAETDRFPWMKHAAVGEAAAQNARAMDMGNMSTPNAADLDAAARRYCAAQGWAMPDGSYPVRPANMHGASDLASAIRAVGRGGGSHDAIRRHIIKRAKAIGMSDQIPSNWTAGGQSNSADPETENRYSAAGDLFRSVPFELTAAERDSDGLTLEGYAAVFNRKALIKDWDGEFEEQIAPGAFRESLERRMPVLMFEHGKHPLIGSMPLGVIDPERTREDARGLFISARLSDNWLIQPVRDAVRDGAVTGMSFRFPSPAEEDQKWQRRTGKPDLRTLLRLDVPELGPVVFPAYEPTTATVRSALEQFPEDFTGAEPARSGPAGGRDAQPGHGRTSPSKQTALRDRAWKLRRMA